jgi:hypothetical protein
MKPLVTSDLAAFAIVVGVVIAGCVIARLFEYRAWFRGLPMYVDDEVLPEPEWRPRVQKIDPARKWIVE